VRKQSNISKETGSFSTGFFLNDAIIGFCIMQLQQVFKKNQAKKPIKNVQL